ncbi:MAG: hypothetical protein N2445_08790, partial [Acidobacteria bacterium]|nr:hypothetical protein [Acidobacteriota bacterium]
DVYKRQPLDSAHNYFHLIGASSFTDGYGLTVTGYDYSYIFTGGIMAMEGDILQNQNRLRYTTNHELVHQFSVNSCAASVGGHDTPTRMSWCSLENACNSFCDECPAVCLMSPLQLNLSEDAKAGITRLCVEDLYFGDPNCETRLGAIRKEVDPK